MNLPPNTKLNIKSTIRDNWPFVAMLSVPVFIAIAATIKRNDLCVEGWKSLLVSAALPFVIAVWLKRFRIEVANGILRYRSGFALWYREIHFADIQSAKTEVGKENFRPFVRLVIKPTKESKLRRLDINLKVFSLKDIRILLDLLEARKLHKQKSKLMVKGGHCSF